MSCKTLPAPAERTAPLTALRRLKMAQSAHRYVRGNTIKFYEWLEAQELKSLPDGPPIWICGDCHAGNLGPVADAKGRVEIQIRDLDQTVIGNPAHDLIRLGLSLATAARGSDLPGVTTAKIIEQMVEGYGNALKSREETTQKSPKCVGIVMKRAVARSWKQLARERIKDAKPTIPLGSKFWPLARAERAAINDLFTNESMRKLATMLRNRPNDASIEVVDAAYWVKGCSSLGRLRVAVLLNVNGQGKNNFCLMDVKQAIEAAAPRYNDVPMPKDNGVRVVEGARHLSPFLGRRMAAAKLLEKPVFVRELLPQDLKLDIERVTQSEAMAAGRFLAGVVGRAHARQMDIPTRRSWQSELRLAKSKTLDAPSWLWASVVSLMAAHEAAYLEHCRSYALEATR